MFSILVATYNRPDLLAEALASVQAQTWSDFECLVVDDAGSVEIALPDDPRFRLLRNATNLGAAGAWNAALQVARGDWVTWLADDDVLTPRRLELAVPALRRGHMSVCGMGVLDGAGEASFRALSGDVRDSILDGFVPSLGVTAIARDLCPPFDLRFRASQDVDWWLKAAHAAQVESTPEVGYLNRRHSGARHGNGLRARAECSELLLQVHRAYFASHPRARAFRHRRLAFMYGRLGQPGTAAKHALRALAAVPSPTGAASTANMLVQGLRAQSPVG